MQHVEPRPETVLAALLAAEPGNHSIGYYAALDAESLVRLGKRAKRLAELECNGVERYDASLRRMVATWTEADQERVEKARDDIRKAATAILKQYGATLKSVSGDPRGYCLKFRLTSGHYNSGDSVWGV